MSVTSRLFDWFTTNVWRVLLMTLSALAVFWGYMKVVTAVFPNDGALVHVFSLYGVFPLGLAAVGLVFLVAWLYEQAKGFLTAWECLILGATAFGVIVSALLQSI